MIYELTTLAVGGVAAGRMLTGHGNSTFYYEQPAIAFPVSIEPKLPSDTYESMTTPYNRMLLTYRTPKGREEQFLFWVSDKIKDEIDLLRELTNGYRPVTVCGKP